MGKKSGRRERGGEGLAVLPRLLSASPEQGAPSCRVNSPIEVPPRAPQQEGVPTTLLQIPRSLRGLFLAMRGGVLLLSLCFVSVYVGCGSKLKAFVMLYCIVGSAVCSPCVASRSLLRCDSAFSRSSLWILISPLYERCFTEASAPPTRRYTRGVRILLKFVSSICRVHLLLYCCDRYVLPFLESSWTRAGRWEARRSTSRRLLAPSTPPSRSTPTGEFRRRCCR